MKDLNVNKGTETTVAMTLAPAGDDYPIAYSDNVWELVQDNTHLKNIMKETGKASQSEVNEALAKLVDDLPVYPVFYELQPTTNFIQFTYDTELNKFTPDYVLVGCNYSKDDGKTVTQVNGSILKNLYNGTLGGLTNGEAPYNLFYRIRYNNLETATWAFVKDLGASSNYKVRITKDLDVCAVDFCFSSATTVAAITASNTYLNITIPVLTNGRDGNSIGENLLITHKNIPITYSDLSDVTINGSSLGWNITSLDDIKGLTITSQCRLILEDPEVPVLEGQLKSFIRVKFYLKGKPGSDSIYLYDSDDIECKSGATIILKNYTTTIPDSLNLEGTEVYIDIIQALGGSLLIQKPKVELGSYATSYDLAAADKIGELGPSGESSVIIDLDNEMDAIPCDSEGKVLNDYTLTNTLRLFKGTKKLTLSNLQLPNLNLGSLLVTCQCILNDANDEASLSWSIPLGTVVVGDRFELSIPVNYEGNTFTSVFTIITQKSGLPGVSPIIYQLLPSSKELKFSVDENSNTYTPSNLYLYCSYTRRNGNNIVSYDGLLDNNLVIDIDESTKYYIYYKINPEEAGSVYALMSTVGSSNLRKLTIPATGDTKITSVEFILSSSSTISGISDSNIIDRENVPVIRDGKVGAVASYLDLTNEMDAIPTDSDGDICETITLSTTAELWINNELADINAESLKSSNDELSISYLDKDLVAHNLLPVITYQNSKATFTWTLPYSSDDKFTVNKAKYEIPIIIQYSGIFYTGTFSLIVSKSGADGTSPDIYQLLPSTSSINFTVDDSNNYVGDGSVYCGWTVRSGSSTTTYPGNSIENSVIKDSSDLILYTIYYRLQNNDGVWGSFYKTSTLSGGIKTIQANDNYKAIQYVLSSLKDPDTNNDLSDDSIIDIETIPIVKGGKNGVVKGYLLTCDNDSVILDDNLIDNTAFNTAAGTKFTLSVTSGATKTIRYKLSDTSTGNWTIAVDSVTGQVTYTIDTTKLINDNALPTGSFATIVDAYVKLEGDETDASSVALDGESGQWVKVAQKKLPIQIKDFNSGEVYKVLVTPNVITADSNSAAFAAGQLSVSALKIKGDSSPLEDTSIQCCNSINPSLSDGELFYTITPTDSGLLSSNLTWQTGDILKDSYVVRLYLKANGGSILVDTETVNRVNNGALGEAGTSPYFMTLSNDSVVIDTDLPTTRFKGFTTSTATLYLGNTEKGAYFKIIHSLQEKLELCIVNGTDVVFSSGSNTTSASSSINFFIRKKNSFDTEELDEDDTTITIEAYLDSSCSTLLATRKYSVSIKALLGTGVSYSLNVTNDTWHYDGDSPYNKVSTSPTSSVISVSKFECSGTSDPVTTQESFKIYTSLPSNISDIDTTLRLIYPASLGSYTSEDLVTSKTITADSTYKSASYKLDLYLGNILIDSETIDCLKDGKSGTSPYIMTLSNDSVVIDTDTPYGMKGITSCTAKVYCGSQAYDAYYKVIHNLGSDLAYYIPNPKLNVKHESGDCTSIINSFTLYIDRSSNTDTNNLVVGDYTVTIEAYDNSGCTGSPIASKVYNVYTKDLLGVGVTYSLNVANDTWVYSGDADSSGNYKKTSTCPTLSKISITRTEYKDGKLVSSNINVDRINTDTTYANDNLYHLVVPSSIKNQWNTAQQGFTVLENFTASSFKLDLYLGKTLIDSETIDCLKEGRSGSSGAYLTLSNDSAVIDTDTNNAELEDLTYNIVSYFIGTTPTLAWFSYEYSILPLGVIVKNSNGNIIPSGGFINSEISTSTEFYLSRADGYSNEFDETTGRLDIGVFEDKNSNGGPIAIKSFSVTFKKMEGVGVNYKLVVTNDIWHYLGEDPYDKVSDAVVSNISVKKFENGTPSSPEFIFLGSSVSTSDDNKLRLCISNFTTDFVPTGFSPSTTTNFNLTLPDTYKRAQYTIDLYLGKLKVDSETIDCLKDGKGANSIVLNVSKNPCIFEQLEDGTFSPSSIKLTRSITYTDSKNVSNAITGSDTSIFGTSYYTRYRYQYIDGTTSNWMVYNSTSGITIESEATVNGKRFNSIEIGLTTQSSTSGLLDSKVFYKNTIAVQRLLKGTDVPLDNLYSYDVDFVARANVSLPMHTETGFAAYAKRANTSDTMSYYFVDIDATLIILVGKTYSIHCQVKVPAKGTGSFIIGSRRLYTNGTEAAGSWYKAFCTTITKIDDWVLVSGTLLFDEQLKSLVFLVTTGTTEDYEGIFEVQNLKIEDITNTGKTSTKFIGLGSYNLPTNPNLLKGTSTGYDTSIWNLLTASNTTILDNEFKGYDVIKSTFNTGVGSYARNFRYALKDTTLKTCHVYTLSWWEKASNANLIVNPLIEFSDFKALSHKTLPNYNYLVSYCNEGGVREAAPTKHVQSNYRGSLNWVFRYLVFLTTAGFNAESSNISIHVQGTGDYYISKLKLEEGSVPTPYILSDSDDGGHVIRMRGEYSSTEYYYNDTDLKTSNVKYVDVVLYTDDNGTMYYYLRTSLDSGTRGKALPDNKDSSNSYWKNVPRLESIATKLLIADDAWIQYLTGRLIFCTNAANLVTAGVNGLATGNQPVFWAGSNFGKSEKLQTLANDAPFRVNMDGSLYASNSTISGNIENSKPARRIKYVGDFVGNVLGNTSYKCYYFCGTWSNAKTYYRNILEVENNDMRACPIVFYKGTYFAGKFNDASINTKYSSTTGTSPNLDTGFWEIITWCIDLKPIYKITSGGYTFWLNPNDSKTNIIEYSNKIVDGIRTLTLCKYNNSYWVPPMRDRIVYSSTLNLPAPGLAENLWRLATEEEIDAATSDNGMKDIPKLVIDTEKGSICLNDNETGAQWYCNDTGILKLRSGSANNRIEIDALKNELSFYDDGNLKKFWISGYNRSISSLYSAKSTSVGDKNNTLSLTFSSEEKDSDGRFKIIKNSGTTAISNTFLLKEGTYNWSGKIMLEFSIGSWTYTNTPNTSPKGDYTGLDSTTNTGNKDGTYTTTFYNYLDYSIYLKDTENKCLVQLGGGKSTKGTILDCSILWSTVTIPSDGTYQLFISYNSTISGGTSNTIKSTDDIVGSLNPVTYTGTIFANGLSFGTSSANLFTVDNGDSMDVIVAAGKLSVRINTTGINIKTSGIDLSMSNSKLTIKNGSSTFTLDNSGSEEVGFKFISGSYGLRVHSKYGIQKTTNGGSSWSNL